MEDNQEFFEYVDGLIANGDRRFDKDHLIQIWSKLQVASILQKQAKDLIDTAQTDLEFYKLVEAQKKMKDLGQ